MKKQPTILISGVAGLAGSHLAKFLLENKLGQVIGVKRDQCDLMNSTAVRQLICETKPDYIFHLAAQSSVPLSWEDPINSMNTNLMPAVHIFEAIRKNGFSTRVLVVGSSEEYGLVYSEELPIKETNALRPLNPYAVSKVAMDLLGWQYFKNYGLHVVRTRSFNNLGASYHKPDATNDWIRQIVKMEQGLSEPVLKVGNLETKRDFVDIRDVVRAYWLALTKGRAGEVYNIASGKPVAMQELLDALLKLTSAKVRIVQDPARLRPSDMLVHYGDSSKLKDQTGWTPRIPLKQSLQDMFNFYVNR